MGEMERLARRCGFSLHTPVGELSEQQLRLLLYGEPGSGKTTLACSGHNHPEMGEVMVINIEGGMLAVSGTSAKATEQVTTIEEVEEIFWHIKARKAPYDKIKTVVVDSGTEFQTVMLGEIVRNEDKKKPNSDSKLVKLLEEEGMKIARRTVAKYRSLLKIPTARRRKQYD